MDLWKILEARRSCRRYMNKPIRREMIDKCLEAARLAPSAYNYQPWRYVVADNPVVVKKLQPLLVRPDSPVNRFASQAPVLVVVTEKPIDLFQRLGPDAARENFSELDIGLSVGQFCLAATAQGLGSCIMGCFDEPAVKQLLEIPGDHTVRLILALGYAAPGEGSPTGRLERAEISAYNAFSGLMK